MKDKFAAIQRVLPGLVGGYENPWLRRPVHRNAAARGKMGGLVTLEVCAGAGGQALGFEQAMIDHAGMIEINKNACATLRLNRPRWNVIEKDLNGFDGKEFVGVDIVSGGLPCPPFSVAGKQLGHKDERNLFPAMIHLVDQVRPKAILIENVRAILEAVFYHYGQRVAGELKKLGYEPGEA